jgi:hypothetical protein
VSDLTRRTTVPIGTYEPDPGWPGLPRGMSFAGAATSVAVDSRDRVYVFNRGPSPLVVLGPGGEKLGEWGTGEFVMPHGVSIDGEDNIWAVDLKHTVHKRAVDGRRLPHGLCFIGDDRVLICDRENFRLQLFTVEGRFLDQWHSYYPQCLRSVPLAGGRTAVLVGEGPRVRYQRDVPNLGCRVRILDERGTEIGRIGTGKWGFAPDAFVSIHGLAIDSRGDVYVAETPYATIVHYYGEAAPEPEPVSLRKWRRVRQPGEEQ